MYIYNICIYILSHCSSFSVAQAMHSALDAVLSQLAGYSADPRHVIHTHSFEYILSAHHEGQDMTLVGYWPTRPSITRYVARFAAS